MKQPEKMHLSLAKKRHCPDLLLIMLDKSLTHCRRQDAEKAVSLQHIVIIVIRKPEILHYKKIGCINTWDHD
jgi:hypothetical protein